MIAPELYAGAHPGRASPSGYRALRVNNYQAITSSFRGTSFIIYSTNFSGKACVFSAVFSDIDCHHIKIFQERRPTKDTPACLRQGIHGMIKTDFCVLRAFRGRFFVNFFIRHIFLPVSRFTFSPSHRPNVSKSLFAAASIMRMGLSSRLKGLRTRPRLSSVVAPIQPPCRISCHTISSSPRLPVSFHTSQSPSQNGLHHGFLQSNKMGFHFLPRAFPDHHGHGLLFSVVKPGQALDDMEEAGSRTAVFLFKNPDHIRPFHAFPDEEKINEVFAASPARKCGQFHGRDIGNGSQSHVAHGRQRLHHRTGVMKKRHPCVPDDSFEGAGSILKNIKRSQRPHVALHQIVAKRPFRKKIQIV